MKINNNVLNNSVQKKQSFNGIGSKAVEGMINISDKIASAGFIAQFIVQDGIGSIIPRIGTGLTRNSDVTGELNYKFASLEACREILTGPPVMFIPVLTYGLAKKYIGSTLMSSVSTIEAFSEKLKNVVLDENIDLSDASAVKRGFYSQSWKKALCKTCGEGYSPDRNLIEKLTTLMTELETAPKKAVDAANTRTTKTILGEISSLVTSELKSHANVKSSFSKISYEDGLLKAVKAPITEFANHMQNFSKDFLKNIKGFSAEDPNAAKILTTNINTLKNKRIGSRVLMNFVTIGAVLLYSIGVPKLYKRMSKTNPGLIGLEEKKTETVAEYNAPVNYEAFNKFKEGKNPAFKGNKPSFKGSMLNRIANSVQSGGLIRKAAGAFEFDGINMTFAPLMAYMGLGILVPRVKNAYDKHDKREILTRDIFTIAALVAGAKALLKTVTRMFEKSSGIVMSEKASNYAEMPRWRRICEHLRPFGGTQVYSNEDILLKYTDVDKFNGGFEGFCNYIKQSGGNLVKLFANDKAAASNMESMLGKKLKDATDNEILEAVKNKSNAQYIENIVKVFKDNNNTFVKKAKSITGVFGFVSTLIVIPAFMIFLQKFNEKVTKHAIAKEQAEKKSLNQKFTALRLTTNLLTPEKSKLNIK